MDTGGIKVVNDDPLGSEKRSESSYIKDKSEALPVKEKLVHVTRWW